MLEFNKAEEIKKLIKSGFDLELISFEFDIPIEEVRKFKEELENSEKSNVTNVQTKESKDKSDEPVNSKMQQIKERYISLFTKTDKKIEAKTERELTQEEIVIINTALAEIEKLIGKMKQASRVEKPELAKNILLKVKEIESYPLTVEQLERLNTLLHAKELEKVNLNLTQNIDRYIAGKRKSIIDKLATAIDIEQSQTEEIEELKRLQKKITIEMTRRSPLTAGAVRSRIERKISEIKQQQLINRIRNEVPANIENIINDLAQGQILDIQRAEEIITLEAKKKLENKPQNKFSLTEEQEKKHILLQIKTALREKADKYPIENIEVTIEQIQKLCGVNLEQAIRIVEGNLMARKEFEKAKELCKRFSDCDKEGSLFKYLVTLKKEIRNAEIGEMVLKGINMNGTIEEQDAYFELIEKGLKAGNIKLAAVSLGKSKDGSRTITLADIWVDNNKREKVK